MNSYRIESRAGVDHGTYDGAAPQEALLSMFRDAGYGSTDVWQAEDGSLVFADARTKETLGDVGDWLIDGHQTRR